MRVVKILIGLVLVLLVIGVLGGLLLPDRSVVERSIQIERPPEQVFAMLNGFARFNEWSPWRDYDPSASYRLEGPASGVGAILRWQGERGAGSQEIVAIDAPRSIAVKLDFGMDGEAMAGFALRPEVGGTHLTWRLDSDAKGSLVARWFGLLLDRMVGADYERGLADLKALLESTPVAAAAAVQATARPEDAPMAPTEAAQNAETADEQPATPPR